MSHTTFPDPRSKPSTRNDPLPDKWPKKDNMSTEDWKNQFVGRFENKHDDHVDAASWTPQKSQAYEKKMANKFLPFIVEKSTPINIYQTLLSRSKGMNTLVVIAVFQLVLQKGIIELRNKVKALDEMPLEAMYEELLNMYPESRIKDKELQLFLAFGNHLPDEASKYWAEELNEFSRNDILAFFLVLAKTGKLADTTDIAFDDILNQEEVIMGNIQNYVKFSDTGVLKQFENEIDLKAYILYRALINSSEGLPDICASFMYKEES